MMISNILGVTLGQWLGTWYHIVAIVMIVIGICLYVFSKRIAEVFKKTDKIEPNDKLVLTLRIIGLAIFVVALVLFCLPPKGFN